MSGKCVNCKYMYRNETMNDFYICVNGKSSMIGQFIGFCCEDECEDFVSFFEDAVEEK